MVYLDLNNTTVLMQYSSIVIFNFQRKIIEFVFIEANSGVSNKKQLMFIVWFVSMWFWMASGTIDSHAFE